MKTTDLSEIYCITVHGDSYYMNRIKRESYRIIKDEMHSYKGLFGSWDGDNVGTEKEIDEKMMSIAQEMEDDSFDYGDVQTEDNLIYYQKENVQELINDWCDDEDDRQTMLEMLGLKSYQSGIN